MSPRDAFGRPTDREDGADVTVPVAVEVGSADGGAGAAPLAHDRGGSTPGGSASGGGNLLARDAGEGRPARWRLPRRWIVPMIIGDAVIVAVVLVLVL